jgi:ribulose-phosphate 3-epimerase
MAIICPTIMPTSDSPEAFTSMMQRLGVLAPRLQIDLMDGQFAPHHNTIPDHVWWPEGKKADIHLMYVHPEEAVRELLLKHPNMIIIHAEAHGDLPEIMREIQEAGVKAGIALLRTTNVEDARDLIEIADHVLLFGGELGGDGVAELGALDKVAQIRALRDNISDDEDARIEIGWDGGANEDNVLLLAGSGIDVVNVGGALRNATDPVHVYRKLVGLAG